jgi:hypothetical protein
MATTDLHLHEPGSLPRPGPVGRLVRVAFGLLCLWYVTGLVAVAGDLFGRGGEIRAVIWNGLLPGLFLISYVVNIGYSRSWKKRPAYASALLFAVLAAAGFSLRGTIETEWLARPLWVWEVYLFSHLGLAFLIAAVIRTPGCEMRSLHDLYSRISGVPAKEHRCPIGPLHPIDRWESRRKSR